MKPFGYFKKFASNVHLKQADVVFVLNADKHNALVAQARKP